MLSIALTSLDISSTWLIADSAGTGVLFWSIVNDGSQDFDERRDRYHVGDLPATQNCYSRG